MFKHSICFKIFFSSLSMISSKIFLKYKDNDDGVSG